MIRRLGYGIGIGTLLVAAANASALALQGDEVFSCQLDRDAELTTYGSPSAGDVVEIDLSWKVLPPLLQFYRNGHPAGYLSFPELLPGALAQKQPTYHPVSDGELGVLFFGKFEPTDEVHLLQFSLRGYPRDAGVAKTLMDYEWHAMLEEFHLKTGVPASLRHYDFNCNPK